MLLISSLLTATVAIMLGGIPAALYEHVTGQKESNVTALWIWLVGVAVISLPAIQAVFAVAF